MFQSRKVARLFASALLATVFVSQAHADGLPGTYGAPPAACCFTWTGFYYGVNAGAAWNDSRDISFSGTDTGSGGFGSEIADGTTPSRVKLDWVQASPAAHRWVTIGS